MAEEFENTSQDTQADVKGAGTMLAAPFEIARQDTLTEVQQTVNKTDTTIGDIGDPAGEESLVGLIKNIPETVPTGTIKSIQRGMFRWSSGMNTQGAEIVISTVNPEKCIVMLSCSSDNEYGSRSIGEAAVKKLEPEKLSLYVAGSANLLFVWQVIECF